MADPQLKSSKPQCLRVDALAVLNRLRAAGHVAYFAGGCVRDELLGIPPADYDVATDAPPQRVRELFGFTRPVGAAFGVILVHFGRSVIEVATFRSDGAYEDGRRPSQVHFTNAEEDAKRRDFTINGLFLDPIENRVIDYVGGRDDLTAKVIRAIGDPSARFAEDHLRLLRAVRFAARFGFAIEPVTADAIRTNADSLKAISPERVADELRLMLTPPTRTQAMRMLYELRLIDVVMRMLPHRHSTALDESRDLFFNLDPQRPITFGLALAAATMAYRQDQCASDVRALLTPEQCRKAVRAMRQALRISNDDSEEMQQAMESLAPLLADAAPTLAAKKRFLALPHSQQAQQILHAIALIGQHQERIAALEADLGALRQTDFAPPPLLTGDDLVAAGWTPGPTFKHVLEQVYDAQLEGRISTPQDAMAMARRLKG